jgi:hypothetical protein
MDGPHPDIEKEGQPYLAKARIGLLDPILEAVRIKGAHVAREHNVDEVADRLALLLRPGMHQDHSYDGKQKRYLGNAGRACSRPQ